MRKELKKAIHATVKALAVRQAEVRGSQIPNGKKNL